MAAVNTELGLPSNTQISFGSPSSRELVGIPSGAVTLSTNFYSKTKTTLQFNNAQFFENYVDWIVFNNGAAFITFNPDGTILFGDNGGSGVTSGPTAFTSPTGGVRGSFFEISVSGVSFPTNSTVTIWNGVTYPANTAPSTAFVPLTSSRTISLPGSASDYTSNDILGTFTIRRIGVPLESITRNFSLTHFWSSD